MLDVLSSAMFFFTVSSAFFAPSRSASARDVKTKHRATTNPTKPDFNHLMAKPHFQKAQDVNVPGDKLMSGECKSNQICDDPAYPMRGTPSPCTPLKFIAWQSPADRAGEECFSAIPDTRYSSFAVWRTGQRRSATRGRSATRAPSGHSYGRRPRFMSRRDLLLEQGVRVVFQKLILIFFLEPKIARETADVLEEQA